MIQEATQKLSQRNDLTANEMEAVMEEIMTGKVDKSQIVSFFFGLDFFFSPGSGCFPVDLRCSGSFDFFPDRSG